MRLDFVWKSNIWGMSYSYVRCQSTLLPRFSAKDSTNPRVSAMWMEYTHSDSDSAFSRKGRSAWAFWHPKGGFMTTVSAPSKTSFTSDPMNDMSAPNDSAFSSATARALSDLSYPTTIPA